MLVACGHLMADSSSHLSHGYTNHSFGSYVLPSLLLMPSFHPSSQLLSRQPTSSLHSFLVVRFCCLPSRRDSNIGCGWVVWLTWCCIAGESPNTKVQGSVTKNPTGMATLMGGRLGDLKSSSKTLPAGGCGNIIPGGTGGGVRLPLTGFGGGGLAAGCSNTRVGTASGGGLRRRGSTSRALSLSTFPQEDDFFLRVVARLWGATLPCPASLSQLLWRILAVARLELVLAMARLKRDIERIGLHCSVSFGRYGGTFTGTPTEYTKSYLFYHWHIETSIMASMEVF